MTGFLLWMVLLFLCWPLALLAVLLYPILWLLLLPFRLLRAVLMLPARLLGGGPGR